ncbi:MAG: NAD(P)H-hydrate dehydratase, partial [Clostridia bacterium]|nr:NAD(P)H-hydrate dehydratase [Clostridia bacterium]
RAARSMLDSYHFEGRTAIVCGVGNNGGDGYALAYLLRRADVYYLAPPLTDDARYYMNKCVDNGVFVNEYTAGCLHGYDTIVDCIFGVGLNRPEEGKTAEVIREINSAGAYVISADIPSGLFADSGLCGECVKADMTVTFAALKPGHFLNDGLDKCGEVKVCDIGTSSECDGYIIEKEDLKSLFAERKRNCNKGTYGYVSIIGGCERYGGAAKLANMAASAMRVGAGVVRLAVGRSLSASVSPYLLESTLYPMPDKDGYISFDPVVINGALEGTRAVSVGMGMGHGEDTDKVVSYVIGNYTGRLVLDADALNVVSRIGCDILRNAKGRIVITPHPGEFARLCSCTVADVLSDPMGLAKAFAKEYNIIVLLKGCTTVITDGEAVYLCDRGCAGQATAGSGDVLSGVLCGLLGYTDDILAATIAGAYLCGEAACLAQAVVGEYSMIASDTLSRLPEAILNIQK